MVQVLEVVAARLGHDPIELADIVWENTKRVFFPDELQSKQPRALTTDANSDSSTAN